MSAGGASAGRPDAAASFQSYSSSPPSTRRPQLSDLHLMPALTSARIISMFTHLVPPVSIARIASRIHPPGTVNLLPGSATHHACRRGSPPGATAWWCGLIDSFGVRIALNDERRSPHLSCLVLRVLQQCSPASLATEEGPYEQRLQFNFSRRELLECVVP